MLPRAMLGVVVLSLAAPAHAGNEDEILLGREAAMTGGAVTASTSTGASLFYNPAGIMNIDEPRLDASFTVYGLRHYAADGVLSLSNGQDADATINEVVVVPNATSYVRPVTDDMRAGLGIFIDRWSDFTLRARLLDRSPLADFTAAARNQRITIVIGTGFRLSENLRFGFSIQALWSTSATSLQFAAGDSSLAVSAATLQETAGIATRFGAGLQWDITPWLTAGLSMVIPSARLWSRSTADELTLAYGGGAGELRIESDDESGFGWEWEHPQRMRFGLAFAVGEGQLLLDGDVSHALRNDDILVAREWEGNARLGFTYPVADGWELGAGAFTDRSTEEDGLDFYGGALGVAIEDIFDLREEDADALTFDSSFALRYAYGSGPLDTIDLDVDPLPFTARSGVTELVVHEITLQTGGGIRF